MFGRWASLDGNYLGIIKVGLYPGIIHIEILIWLWLFVYFFNYAFAWSFWFLACGYWVNNFAIGLCDMSVSTYATQERLCHAWQGPYRWPSKGDTMRMRIFSCYRWKLRGGKTKDLASLSSTSLSTLSLRFHMPVPESMRVVSSVSTEKSCCTWSTGFGQEYAPGKSHLYILLCFSCDNAYWNWPGMVTLHLQLLVKLVSISWNSWFLEEYFLGEVNATYIRRCFFSWPLLFAQNVKITSSA